jgi:alpha-tubulin suppressor-like RCC1 family protein
LGLGDYITRKFPTVFTLTQERERGLEEIGFVATGPRSSLVLTTTGRLLAWGYDVVPSLTSESPRSLPEEVPLWCTPRQIACGLSFSALVSSEGHLFLWGANRNGQLGQGDILPRSAPVKVSLPAPVHSLALGESHVIVLCSNGSLFAWGANSEGQLGLGHKDTVTKPMEIPRTCFETSSSSILKVVCGTRHSLALTSNGCLYGWGSNKDKQLYPLPKEQHSTPQLLHQGILEVASGSSHVIALQDDKTLLLWGRTQIASLLPPEATSHAYPGSRVPLAPPLEIPPQRTPVVSIGCGNDFSYFVNKRGKLFLWGINSQGVLGREGPTARPRTVESILLEVPNFNWLGVFRWLFLGSRVEDCIFYGLPIEVIFQAVILFGYRL